MKFTRSKTLIVLLVLGLIVVYANLLLSYVNQEKSQSSLRYQIETAVKTSTLLPSVPADIPKRLEDAQKSYNTALTSVSVADIDSTQIMEALIETADVYNLDINPAITDQWMERTFGLSTYRVLPLTLEISGNRQDIISYVLKLEDQTLFPHLAIEGLRIVEASPDAATPEGDRQQATLNANIVVRLTPIN
jgi:hypothetical protein